MVVYSIVDGVLLDPHTSPFFRAASTLSRLALDDCALVLCSGKTRAELEFVQQKLNLRHPFICEHGGAVLIPKGYFGFHIPSARDLVAYHAVEFGRAYADLVDTLHRTADRLRIEVVGFSDMSIEEVARECNMPLLQARLAKLREYEEPFRILSPGSAARARLVGALHGASLRCIAGDRFDHVGAQVDSSLGVSLLTGLYRRSCDRLTTVGVTHPMPDESLLGLVDYAITVPNHDTSAGAIDVVDWAEAIVDTVWALRRRATPSRLS